jgi:drug/metabolite transporter (DMT)-like permease
MRWGPAWRLSSTGAIVRPDMARLMALLGVLGLSFAAIFVRLADVSPNTTAVFRGLYALPVLLVTWWAVRHHDTRPLALRGVAVAAGLLLALDFTFWHRGIALIGAGLATVLVNTQVIFVALLAWLILGERPPRLALWMVPVVFGGVVLASGAGQTRAYGDAPLTGALLATLAGMAYAGFILVLRAANRMRQHPAGPLLDTTVGLTVGSLLLGLTDPGLDLVPHLPAHGWLIALALVVQVAGWLCLGVALPRLPALETSVLILLQPVGTVAWGWLLFDERMGPGQWVGTVLVLGGVGVLTLAQMMRPSEGAPVEPS